MIQLEKSCPYVQFTNYDKSHAVGGPEIDKISRPEPCALCSDMKYIGSCTTHEWSWWLMLMDGRSISHVIDYLLLSN